MGFDELGKDYDSELERLKKQLKKLQNINATSTNIEVSLGHLDNQGNDIAELKKKLQDIENKPAQSTIKLQINNLSATGPHPTQHDDENKVITTTARQIESSSEGKNDTTKSAQKKTSKKSSSKSTKKAGKTASKKKAKKIKKKTKKASDASSSKKKTKKSTSSKAAKSKTKKPSTKIASNLDEKMEFLSISMKRLESAISKLVILFGKATDDISKDTDRELFEKLDYIILQNKQVLAKLGTPQIHLHTEDIKKEDVGDMEQLMAEKSEPEKKQADSPEDQQPAKEAQQAGENDSDEKPAAKQKPSHDDYIKPKNKDEDPGYLEEIKPKGRHRLSMLKHINTKKEELMPFELPEYERHENPKSSPFLAKPKLPPGFDYNDDAELPKTNTAPPPPDEESLRKLKTKESKYDL